MNFDKIAQLVARGAGRPLSFIVAFTLMVVWGISGPVFKFSNTWQLVVNTGTTIVTFLMVFLIQNTQNRDTDAMQIKLDELIRVTKGARLALLDMEELKSDELQKIKSGFIELGKNNKESIDT